MMNSLGRSHTGAAHWGCNGSLVGDGFQLKVELDLAGDDHVPGFEDHVPASAPVFVVDGSGRGEDRPMVSPWVGEVPSYSRSAPT